MASSLKNDARIQTLKKQRRFLRSFTILELTAAFFIPLIEIANHFADQEDFMMRLIHFELTQFDKIILKFSSIVFIDSLRYLIFPSLCLAIQITLFVYTYRNRLNPVTGQECAWAILFVVQIPSFLWCLTGILVRFPSYPWWDITAKFVNHFGSFCINLSIFLVNSLLLHNLHQYTKAIRKEKAREANAAIADQTSID